MLSHIAYISVGSNMGNKVGHCRKGIRAMTISGATEEIGRSRFYKTAPVDFADQDWFVNAVFKIKTRFDPYDLMAMLQTIQREAGRTRDLVRYGPRELDLDILFYDDLVLSSRDLEIPHPRMHKRRFVLVPLCDIDPLIVHPVLKEDVTTLLNRLSETDQKVIPCS